MYNKNYLSIFEKKLLKQTLTDMHLKHLLLTTAGLSLMLGLQAQVKKTFHVTKPGTLIEQMTEAEANEITHLTLQGKINAVDFRHLRDEFKQLQVLDISTASIASYAGKHGTHRDGFYIYPPNSIPAFAFCRQQNDSIYQGKSSLRHVILSDKTRNIEDGAFKGCTNLQICQIRKKTAPNLLPEALADSITAIFIPLGSGDSYRAKERWTNFAFIEGEPLAVTVQISALSSLSDELQQKGIHPRDVHFLTVEGKMNEADFTLVRNFMPNLVTVDFTVCNATHIPAYTFTQKKYLLNVRLPKGLKSIGQRAFSGCVRLRGPLMLPTGLTAIEYGAFIGCENLHQVIATGQRITTLGDQLFGDSPSRLVLKK